MALFPRSRVRIVAVSPSLPPSLSCGFSLLRGAKKKADGRMSGERVLHGPASQTGATTLSLITAPHATHARMHDLLQLLKFHQYIQGWAKKWSPGCESFSGQVEAEVEINSRNKIHQTWGQRFSPPLYSFPTFHRLPPSLTLNSSQMRVVRSSLNG